MNGPRRSSTRKEVIILKIKKSKIVLKFSNRGDSANRRCFRRCCRRRRLERDISYDDDFCVTFPQ